MNPSDRFLRLALRGNATFSVASGLTCGLAAGPVAAAMGIPEPGVLTGLGLQLCIFAALLYWLASRPEVAVWLAVGVVLADVLWVVGTIPLVVSGALTATGNAVALAIAAVVATFAVLQTLGIKRMRAPAATA